MVSVSLNSAGRRLLAALGSLSATLNVLENQTRASVTAATTRVVFKGGKRHHKKH
jgi:hypothetical protein